MPQVGIEPTIPALEREKALDRADVVIGTIGVTLANFVIILTTLF
jgi:hypothetical protein